MSNFVLWVVIICLFQDCVHGRATADVNQGSGFEDATFSGNTEGGSGNDETVIRKPPSCTAEYEQETGHTMCMTDDPRVIKSGIGPAQGEEIVDFHNEVRASARPAAADLPKLIWDEKLAAVADKWAKQCIVDHDKNRDIPSYGMFIGQNVAAGYRTWRGAMASWFNEVELYHYGENAETYLGHNGWREIGHYTQLVQNTTSRLGCGYAECTSSAYGRYYVCNYARGQSSTQYPYTSGEQCSACPDVCKAGLCDCEGKLCLNGGQLDIKTCTCKCQKIYQGDSCSQLNCPESDAFYCGRDLTSRDCEVYANVPVLCPYLCGLCGSKTTDQRTDIISYAPQNTESIQDPTTTQAPFFISHHNCSYKGVRCSIDECKNYGDHGSDMQFCQSRGGKFTCSDCTLYYNVKRDYCPVMCGLCDAPCDGKECENSGRLNTDTCQCKCNPPFAGDRCEILTCPEADRWHCRFFDASFCTDYINVPLDCPFLCGICS